MMLLLVVGITLCSLASVNGIESDTPSCLVEGQTFQQCPPCIRFCTNPIPQCPTICTPGCGCPAGQVIDSVNNRCVDSIQCPGPVNCAAVLCLSLVCPPGEMVVVPPGQCCGVCVRDSTNPCNNRTCPTGSQCKVYEPTGEAVCEASCDIDNGGCPANQKCSLQTTVQCVRAPCPPVVKCIPRPQPRCPISGQVYQKCASCFATCFRPFPRCFKRCIPGCRCPTGTVLDIINKKCVNIKQCPSLKCAGVKCPTPSCATATTPTVVPQGKCCPVCACQVGDEVYLSGETFMIDCNGCTCSRTGLPICTQIACSETD